jgi:hypothetical protein
VRITHPFHPLHGRALEVICRSRDDMPLLCINGSAPLWPTNPWTFSIPGIALLKSLLQITNILNANTVLPRVEAMQSAFKRRIYKGMRPDHLDPANLVIDLMGVEDIESRLWDGTWNEELIRATDPLVKKWESDALTRVRIAREHAAKEPDTKWLS